MTEQGAKRIDIVSDTHGYLSQELVDALEGADLIVHAGDMTSESNYAELQLIAPVRAVLGNNDYYRDYGPGVERLCRFTYEGVSIAVSHYSEDLPVGEVDLAVCGHTHRARIVQQGACILVNPGSASYPRGDRGPTIARATVSGGRVVSVKIVDL